MVFLMPSFVFNNSFGLTESVELFGEVNSIDLILYDIWLEPENPQLGEGVSIHGSVYNAGVVPSGNLADALTIGYFVNGELIEIDILKNVLPGIENGVRISSGPIFDALPGEYDVTVIINYHDTLSHLRDNLENNIVQKKFQISDPGVPPLLDYEVYQYYDVVTETHKIEITGSVSGISTSQIANRNVMIDVGDLHNTVMTNNDGLFSLALDVVLHDSSIPVVSYLEDNSLPSVSKNIFPMRLEPGQSALALNLFDGTESANNFKNSDVAVVLFQDSYDNLFKKISINDLDQQSILIDEYVLTTLPGNHEYIGEVYLDGRFIDAFQTYFDDAAVVTKDFFISESSQIKFKLSDNVGMPPGNTEINVWNYAGITGSSGFTEWIDVLPTFVSTEPYVAKATLQDGRVIWSDPFFIDPYERKVIEIVIEDDKQ